MGRIVCVANQKGGVAKTTTVVTLGAALAANGLKVLLIDLDPQSSLTFALGIDPDDVEVSVSDVLTAGAPIGTAVLAAGEALQVVPASLDLAGAESMLLPVDNREFVLRRALEELGAAFDVVLLDCSPSLGLLTLNALAAADELIIPMQAEMLSHRGVGQLLDTVADVQRLLNPRLIVRGLLPTMYDGRSIHARAVLADIVERYQLPVLGPIPRSVRFAEAPGVGGSVLRTSPRSAGAQAYRDVAASLLASWAVRKPRAAKAAATRAPATKAPAAKSPAAKSPAAKSPAAKAPAAKSPATKSPATKSPATKSPATKATVTKVTVTKASATKAAAKKA